MIFDKYFIKGNINKLIINFSDLHYEKDFNNKLLINIISNIKKYKPDYITFTGDLIDNNKVTYYEYEQVKPLFIFLEQLGLIAPTFICLGNHDLFIPDNIYNNDFYNNINNINNIYLLRNNSYSYKDISFSAYESPIDFYRNEKHKDIKTEFNKIKFKYSKTSILLVHSPEMIVENIDIFNKFDIILCGHMHNGLMPHFIKGTFGLITPKLKLFPKYCRGLKRFNGSTLITSGGITKLSNTSKKFHKFNFLYRPQIDLIYIKK